MLAIRYQKYPIKTARQLALVVLLVMVYCAALHGQITYVDPPRDTTALCQYIPPQASISATSTCSGQVTVLAEETRVDGPCEHAYTLIRTWAAEDACANRDTFIQRITVVDQQSPALIGVPANQTVRPGNLPPLPNVRALDFCDADATLQTTIDSVAGPCGGYTLNYLFVGTDACGNRREASYVLSVTDESPPVIDGVTTGRRLACGEDLPPPPTVTASDNGGTPTLTMVRDTLTERGGDTCMIVRRVWTATDDCGLSTTAAQAFTLHDDQAPQLFGIPSDTIIYCEALPAAPALYSEVTATDDCGTATIVYEQTSGQTNDGTCTDVTYEVIRTWTAIDDCGNVTTATQVLHMKCECCFNGIDDDDDGLVDDYDPHCNCFAGVATECDSTKRYYIPPVWHPSEFRYNQPSELVITTLADIANVHIETGDGTTFNATYTVSKGTPLIIPLTTDQLQTPNNNRIENDRGWIITSDQLIQPIYRIDAFYNKVLVTVKGPQAVGRVFRAGSQTNTCGTNNMGNGEGHFISVMATEDDTEVTILPSFPVLGGGTGPIVRTLDKHETYLVRDDYQNTTVSGSLITSTKPIVVTSGSQHTKACDYVNGAYTGRIAPGMDGGIDQLVPNCLTGDEYVLVRGTGNAMQQYATLVANKNNARVLIDGDPGSEIVLNAGEHTQVWLTGNAYQPRHFSANKPFYMFHTSGISANNEVGMAIAAPIGECKGDTLIDFPRFAAPTATAPVRNSVYVILPDAGLPSLRINGQAYSDCAAAQPVPARPDWSVVTFQDACLQANNTIRCNEFFTAGMLVGVDGQTGTHGYLTAFKDRMSIFRPGSDQITTGYLVDTLCGEQISSHCIDVTSCATNHSIAAVRGGQGTVNLVGNTCFEYTSPADFHGEDELLVTLQNDQGLFQTVCLRYFICAQPPEAEFSYLDTVVNCDRIPPLDTPVFTDECDMHIEFDTEDITTPGGCEYAYVVQRHWTIWDDCGDSTRATQTIRVQDTLAPQGIDIPSDTLIAACAGVPPVPTVNFVENCDNSFDWSFRQETVDSTCLYDRTIVRTWEAWDNCGNNSTSVQRIELRDTSAPVFSHVPQDELLSCAQSAALPVVTITDDCDPNPTLQIDSIVYTSICDTLYHVVRRWTATDACGQVATISQRVLVVDQQPPLVLNIPADTSIVCGEPLPTRAPSFTDDCTIPVPVYVVDSTAEGTCPVLSTIYRRWIATDDCGHVTSAEQVIQVIDTLAPSFVPLPDTIFSSCLDSVVVIEPSIVEACNLSVTFTDSMAAGTNCNADRFLYRTYVARDACDRTATYTQLYYFQDNVPPFWVQEPSDTVLTCDQAIPAALTPNVVDACSGINPIALVERDSQRVCPARRWLFRTYTVSDWCGNLSTFTQTIIIDGCEPAIPALATAQADCAGSDIILEAAVDSGYTTPVFLWQFSTDSITWVDLAQPIDSASLALPDANLTNAGFYRVVVANTISDLSVEDCSSLSPPVLLSLYPPEQTQLELELCRGDSLFYLGDTLTVSTVRSDTLATVHGCDSVVTLDLTVYPFVDLRIDTVLCFGESLEIFGTTYATSGSYRDTLLTAYGCDTTLSLELAVLPDLRDTTMAMLCGADSVLFEGGFYALPGVYTNSHTSTQGCDSSTTLVLEQAMPVNTQIDTIICPGASVTVNGTAYNTTGKYVEVTNTTDGCDSTITLQLQVVDTTARTVNVTLCEGEVYHFGDTLIRTPGSFRQNLVGRHGCDSNVVANVTMSPTYDTEITAERCVGEVYVNQNYQFSSPGRWQMDFATSDGCDSTVFVTLIYRPFFDIAFDTTLCAGASYQLIDTTLRTAGTFTRTGISRFGCDSTVTVSLQFRDPIDTLIAATLCHGESLEVGSQIYNYTVRDTLVLQSTTGCDSTLVIDLRVLDDASRDTTALVCEGDAFATGGRLYSETGVFRHTAQDRNGCDSTYTVFLTVMPQPTDTIYQTICAGEQYVFAGEVFDAAGEFTRPVRSNGICDTLATLILSINDTVLTQLDERICFGESFEVGSSSYSTSGNFRDTLQTYQGCDSIVTLSLAVDLQIATAVETQVCLGDSLLINEVWRSQPGQYVDTLSATNNCDSIVTTNLVVLPVLTTELRTPLCAGDTLTHHGISITMAGTYVDTLASLATGCDSIVTLQVNLVPTLRSVDYQTICEGEQYVFGDAVLTEAGRYTLVRQGSNGCDSTSVLELSVIEDIQLETSDVRICRGEPAILEVTGAVDEVRWHPATGLTCPTCPRTEVLAETTTEYTASITDCYGETVSVTALVTVDQAVDVSIVSAEKIRLGERTTLVGVADNPAARMAWREGDELLCDGCSEVEVMPLVTTTYQVEARTVEGCDDTAQLTLIVEDECSFGEVLVPNVITPNADGYNDELEIRYEGIQEIVLLKIFDRWGELVYETQDIDIYWDATHHDQPVNPGVFMYYLEGYCLNGEEFTRQGNVTVVR